MMNQTSSYLGKIGVSLILLVLAAACTHQPIPIAGAGVPSFWLGLWHGLIAPFAFIGSLFTDIRLYAYPNNGAWYDFGTPRSPTGRNGSIDGGLCVASFAVGHSQV